jgi:dCMP deaminase
MTGKRKEYIHWDAYFMALAAVASFRSKDPSTQIGVCIIDPKALTPLSLGYNGFPRGCSDDEFPWARKAENPEDTKYPYVEHAERNAIYNAVRNGVQLEGSVLYMYSEKGYYPCADCARGIIQSGIKEVVMGFAIEDDTDTWHWTETFRLLKAGGIKLRVLVGESTPTGEAHQNVKDFQLLAKKADEMRCKMEIANNG